MAEFRKSGGFGGGARSRGARPEGGKPKFARKSPFGASRGRDDARPPQMYTATCANCGKKCEVSFRPSNERPVFCRDCFGDKRDASPRGAARPENAHRFEKRDSAFSVDAPSRGGDSRVDDLKRQVDALNRKIDLILEIVQGGTSAVHAAPKTDFPRAPRMVADKKFIKRSFKK